MKKVIKKPKKITRGKLVKTLDALFSQYIRRKYSIDGLVKCYTCGVVKPIKEMQNGHYITRGCHLLRRDERNCRVQCVACNIYKSGNYIEYTVRMIKEVGLDQVDELIRQKSEIKGWKTYEIEEMITKYKSL